MLRKSQSFAFEMFLNPEQFRKQASKIETESSSTKLVNHVFAFANV